MALLLMHYITRMFQADTAVNFTCGLTTGLW